MAERVESDDGFTGWRVLDPDGTVVASGPAVVMSGQSSVAHDGQEPDADEEPEQ